MRKTAIITMGSVAALVAAAAVVYLVFFAPRDWARNLDDAKTGVDEAGNPWVGAEKPSLTIHEYLDFDCPHCSAAHQMVRNAIADRFDTIRLVRHDYARMACAPIDETFETIRCEMARAARCASKQVSYWKWNDAVIRSPRTELDDIKAVNSYVENLRASMKITKEAFDSCLRDAATTEFVQSVYLDAKKQRVRGTPTYIVDGVTVSFEELLQRINSK